MLQFLRISNLAILTDLDVEFADGLNILSGETGAGKSIIVNAIGLLLGEKASRHTIRTGETNASVEGIFSVDPASPSAALATRLTGGSDTAETDSGAELRTGLPVRKGVGCEEVGKRKRGEARAHGEPRALARRLRVSKCSCGRPLICKLEVSPFSIRLIRKSSADSTLDRSSEEQETSRRKTMRAMAETN